MSVTAINTTKQEFSTDGATTAFSYTVKFVAKADLTVSLRNNTTGAITSLVLDTDYTISATGNDYTSGATITTTSTYASGSTLVVYRDIADAQSTSFPAGSAILNTAYETALDKLTMLVQQLQTEIEQMFRAPLTDETMDDLPVASSRANKYLKFDADGQPTAVALTATGTGNTVTWSNTYLASSYSTLKQAIDAIGGVTATLIIDSNSDANSETFTIPINVTLLFVNNAVLQNSDNVTINGYIFANPGREVWSSTDRPTAIAADCARGLTPKNNALSELQNKTADFTITKYMHGCIFSNRGDPNAIEFTLPDGSDIFEGFTVRFIVLAAQNFDIDPGNSEKIILDGTVTNANGDRVRASAIGDSLTLMYNDLNEWVALAQNGSWTDVN